MQDTLTVCIRNVVHLYVVSRYIKMDKSSWTHSITANKLKNKINKWKLNIGSRIQTDVRPKSSQVSMQKVYRN